MSAELFSVFYQFADVFTFLILSAAGLAIVFGMMGVINMAHGEFIMCGAYVTVGLVKLGVPLADRPGARRADGRIDRRRRRIPHRPALLQQAAGFAARHLGPQPDRHAIHAADRGIVDYGHRYAGGQLRDRGLHVLDLSSGVVRLCGRCAGRSLYHLHEDAFRRDGARDNAECRHGTGVGRTHAAASMRSASASAPGSRACAARFMRRR